MYSTSQVPFRMRSQRAIIRFVMVVMMGWLLTVAFSIPVQANTTTIQVTTPAELNNAIITANNNAQQAVIVEIMNDLTFTQAYDTLATYGTNAVVQNNFSLTINGNGHTISRDANSPEMRLFIFNIASVTINDMTIDGFASTNGYSGGSIYSIGSILELNNVVIRNSQSDLHGGGIYATNGGRIEPDFATVEYSHAMGNGGGIAIDGTTIEGSALQLKNNIADGHGGGLYMQDGVVDVEPNGILGRFQENVAAGNGGGVAGVDSDITGIWRTLGNQASGHGGGIHLQGSGVLVLAPSSEIRRNIAEGDGGGAYLGPNIGASLNQMIVRHNISRGRGGGYFVAGSLVEGSGFVAENIAHETGAAYAVTGTIGMSGMTIQNNQLAQIDTEEGGAIAALSGSYDIAVVQSCINNNDTVAIYNATANVIDATQNQWGASNGPGGFGPGDGDHVSKNVDFSNFETDTTDCTDRRQPVQVNSYSNLRSALINAETTRGTTYIELTSDILTSGLSYTPDPYDGLNAVGVINNKVVIDGQGYSFIFASGTDSDDRRVFSVNGEAVVNPPASITDPVVYGILHLKDITFTGADFTVGDGGVIHNVGGFVAADNVTFSSNDALNGAVIASEQGAYTQILNSTFENNRALSGSGHGGAIMTQDSTLMIDNTAFDDNQAMLGGAIYTDSNQDSITGSVFDNNSATTDGGAIYALATNADHNISVQDSCILRNSDNAISNQVANTLIATNNWWGSTSGPSGNGPGGGDAVSANVDISGFLTSPPTICNDAVDLELINMDAFPELVPLEDDFFVQVSVRNPSMVNASNVTINVYYSEDTACNVSNDAEWATYTAPSINAGATLMHTFTIAPDYAQLNQDAQNAQKSALKVGNESEYLAYVCVVVDPKDTIKESDESNNTDVGFRISYDNISYHPYDVDGDGLVTPLDAVQVINTQGKLVDGNIYANLDFDGSGTIDAADADGILAHLGLKPNTQVDDK